MNSRVFSSIVFVLVLTMSHTALGKSDGPKTAPQVPDGWIVVEEEIWLAFPDEPGAQFHQAHENFLKRDYKAAAANMRKAVGFMKLETARAAGDAKKALTASIHKLEKLADDVEKGTVSSARKLSEAFSRAHEALAIQHHAKASEAWAKKQSTKVGRALKAAAMHLESAAAWSGQKLEAGDHASLQLARSVGKKITEGASWTAEEAGKAIEGLGRGLKALGERIEPLAE
ncbi:MAG: hypothetical protein JW883_10060 [Deltaproteobacteria bacterium]|nr:hypothetical protein [Deltaproteobacteria bacterium]